MKILYAIQGTGNGHISRAIELIPLLQKKCETDILISSCPVDAKLPFDVKYRLHGLGFVFGKKGGIDYRKTYEKAEIKKLIKEIKTFPAKDYNFIINDFEPVSSWASYLNKVPCVALSHQASLINKNVPKPRYKDQLGAFFIKNYAPASFYFGLHFCSYSKIIYTPIIRKEIREAVITEGDHFTVYLPAYDDKSIIKVLEKIPDTKWHVFSRFTEDTRVLGNITINPLGFDAFNKSLISCRGILCGAGFETPAEAMFLGKKLMVVPMKSQFEQQFNAAALKTLGVPVINKFSSVKLRDLCEWIASDLRIEITYPDITERIINRIFEMYVEGKFCGSFKWQDNFRLIPGRKNKELFS
jgi:uncharacterized protein (TIGR00661 family)